MSSKPVVMIVSYFFAPSPQVGAKRFSFLAPELIRLGFDVRVIAGRPVAGEVSDPSLPVESQVYRIPARLTLPRGNGVWGRAAKRIARKLLAPVGIEFFWTGPAVSAAKRLGLGDRRGVVIGTVPPFSAAIAATRIASNLKWPLILDYRDPWTAYPSASRARGGWKRSGWSRAVASRLERACVVHSKARVFNTDEMKALFEEYFPQADRQWNFVIPNGVQVPQQDIRVEPASMRDIVHAGAMYGDRSFLPVLRALAAIIQEDARFREVKLVQYGELLRQERHAIEAEKLQHLLVEKSRIARDALWPILCAARVLLVVSGREMNYSIPFKVYDYLATRRPILALAPAGSAVARMFADYRIGAHVDSKDDRRLRTALRNLLEMQSYESDGRAIESHLWSGLAEDYAQIVELVRSGGKAACGPC